MKEKDTSSREHRAWHGLEWRKKASVLALEKQIGWVELVPICVVHCTCSGNVEDKIVAALPRLAASNGMYAYLELLGKTGRKPRTFMAS